MVHQILRHQRINLPLPQAVDVHGFARSKVNQALRALGFAQHAAAATRHRFAFFALDAAAANRAMLGQAVLRILRRCGLFFCFFAACQPGLAE